MMHRQLYIRLPLALGTSVYVSLLSSIAAGQDVEPKQISLTTLKCIVDNSNWLQMLPEDPLVFFGDLCPQSADNDSVENSVRVDVPDVAMKPDPAAAPTLQLTIRKGGLKCLSEYGNSITVPLIDLLWSQGVVVGIGFENTEVDFANCTISSNSIVPDKSQ